MKRAGTILFGLLVLGAASPRAQEPLDPVQKQMFPPELVMQHQRALGLSDRQRTSIKKEIKAAQARFSDLEWDLQEEMENLVVLLGETHVDEQAALSALEKVLGLEAEIKQTHLSLAIRIKNVLTPEQQAKLRELRPEPKPRRGGPRPGGPRRRP